MTEPLRLGVAGMGVVGSGLARLLHRQGNALGVRAGRGIDFAAYSALARCDGRPEIGDARFWASPVELAAQGDIDAFVELIGGADGSRLRVGQDGARARPAGRHRQQGNACQARARAGALERRARRAAVLRGGGRRRHSGDQDPAREPRRQHDRARLGNSQRHLQLHPVPDGDGQAAVRGLPRRGPAARLRRSRPDLRHRRIRHRP